MIDISIKVLGALAFSSLAFGMASAPADPEAEIRKTVEAFVLAGDQRNAEELEVLLHSSFRIVANQLMGSSAVIA